MEEGKYRSIPWWMIPRLWGLDVAVLALCWGVAYAALMQITMITGAPLLLLGALAWCGVMYLRLGAALRSADAWHAGFYRRNVAPLAVLLACVGMAALWLLLYYVGQNMLPLLAVPAVLYGLALWDRSGSTYVAPLARGCAFALACAAPACYFSFTRSAPEMLTSAPNWYLGILVFVYTECLGAHGYAGRRRMSTVAAAAVICAVLVMSLLKARDAAGDEAAQMLTVAMAAGCTLAMVQLRRGRLAKCSSTGRRIAEALGWLGLAVPAVLGVMQFAPEHW